MLSTLTFTITASDFFSFDLGRMLFDALTGFLKYSFGDISGLFTGGQRFMIDQYKLAFDFKALFNDEIRTMLDGIGNVTLYFSLFLIVLMFIKKGVGCYILWSDGDPDVDPSQLLIRFMMAIITAISMHLFYDWVLQVATELIGALDQVTNLKSWIFMENMFKSYNSTNIYISIFSIIAGIKVLSTSFKLVGEGLSLTILKWILPITCVGLLDNDKGLFAETWKAMIRIVSTVIIQYYVLQIGLYIIFHTNGGAGLFGFGGVLSYILAITVLSSATKIANLLNQIFIPVQQNGGGLQKAAYPAMMMSNVARGFFGKK